MVAMYDLHIALLQETMVHSETVKKVLEGCLLGWAFEAVDVVGKSRGASYWMVKKAD